MRYVRVISGQHKGEVGRIVGGHIPGSGGLYTVHLAGGHKTALRWSEFRVLD